ncbi:uncharacterized protein LOC114276808 [Camellia sinensis]|uniref:uncharacterized protein LOC114276808 n=1 Tax=Camellia sinensis TaxID=4442 RepID=UPI001035672C|nr:uncharacterized protein LOC114276808 [Camellia sinensis]
MDQLTEQGSRVSFARVCVEVEATSTLPSMFKVNCEDAEAVVKVEYQGLPPKCDHCVVFGHDTTKCVKTQVAALLNLQKQTEDNPDPGWETVKAKGKRKVDVPEIDTPANSKEDGLPKTDVRQSIQLEHIQEESVEIEGEIEAQETIPVPSAVSTPSEGEIEVQEIDGLKALKNSLMEITSLVLPNDVELRAKVENLVETTPGSSATKKAQGGTKAKGSSSGKGNKSQRKKRRGFNNPHRLKEVKKFLLNEDIKILGILETKIKALNEQEIFSGVNNWPFLTNSQPTKTGRICVCWDPAFCKVTLLSASDQYIFCEVHEFSSDNMFKICFVYADNKPDIRKEFFEFMATTSHLQSKTPIMFLGDFNAIRYPYEKSGGSVSWSRVKEEFNSYILKSELVDLSYGGCQFTWANKRTSVDYIATKIDRVLVNEAWLDTFPASFATFLPSGISDHSPAVVNVSDKKSSFKKPFKYLDFWADHKDFNSVVSRVWNQYIYGVPTYRVCQKLRYLKPELKALNKKDFSDITTRVQTSKGKLFSAQCKLDKDPSNCELQKIERTIFKQHVDLLAVEESLALQKSCVQWLSQGDRNSSFFFKTIKGNINRGKILNLELMDGQKSSKIEDIQNAFTNFSLSGKLLSEVNSTIIALIPKVPNPAKVGDFRPISCCNTIYKCIAKIIANRIKSVLPDLIDLVQSAFVQGRRISDNIFLSQELMRGYHRHSPTPKCAMKVDIMKAYDSVRWDFILDILKAMAFPPVMISWIKACITSPSFSICINGSLHGYFKGARGLRQGDPMSPYLFVLAMEILAKILAEKAKHPLFKFHWKCDKTKMINLCFADDLMIFSRGDASTVKLIMEGFKEFSSLSGLIPNPSKSNIYFSGCDMELRASILEIAKFNEGTLPVRYLGVPLITTKLRAADCGPLIDRITKRVKSWTNRALSYAGRSQLIQSILFSMQVYWSSLFILPKKVIR